MECNEPVMEIIIPVFVFTIVGVVYMSIVRYILHMQYLICISKKNMKSIQLKMTSTNLTHIQMTKTLNVIFYHHY